MYQKSFIYSILSFLPKILADSEQIPYSTPEPNANAHFVETFDNGIPNTWYHTLGNKQDEEQNKYSGEFTATALKNNALEGDLGLVAPKKANHYGIGSKLNQPFVFAEEEQLVVSYEVNFQDGLDCGGGYIKLFAEQDDLDIEKFHDKTLFSIMFGPDKCANDFKLHLIVNHRNPITNEYEEKHARMPKADVLKPYYTDAKTHVYKLVLGSDNSYTIYIDGKNVNAGNLLKDMQPAINPPKEIEDPNSVKPEDWDEREKIQDPEATKPEDWDEDAPKEIPDLLGRFGSRHGSNFVLN